MKFHHLILLLPLASFVACDTERDASTNDAAGKANTTEPADGSAAAPEPMSPTSSSGVSGTTEGQGAAATTPGAGGAELLAVADIQPTEGNEARGTVRLASGNGTVRISGDISGLEPGAHGFHVHELGDCSAPDASSAGGHFNPHDDPHGSPRDPEDAHHVGDLGNITANENGEATVDIEDTEMQLSGPESVIGKALVVHAGQDDFESQPSGDSGGRVGCGEIRESGTETGAAATG